MLILEEKVNTTYEIKKSKFISYLVPYCDFKTTMEALKKSHPKARHFIYAYRYLNEFNQIIENCSDDGEPKGTSGKPTLAVIKGKNLINIGVITVRYFGGIRLGTGGLVRAYSFSTNLVIDNAILNEYKKLEIYSITLDYRSLQRYEYKLSKLNINIIDKFFGDNVTLNIECTSSDYKEFISTI
ncbi:MAG TPA: YigZ family protein [Campylobacterales bacterium]|nr:YigZ family protein [Campylobacterales bacterium]